MLCNPDPFAAMVSATPDESTWVVDTASGRLTAGSIELAKVKSVIGHRFFALQKLFLIL